MVKSCFTQLPTITQFGNLMPNKIVIDKINIQLQEQISQT